jgi:hypothetical protein
LNDRYDYDRSAGVERADATANVTVAILIELGGITRAVSAVTDASGRFSYPFFVAEGGDYLVAARHPNQQQLPRGHRFTRFTATMLTSSPTRVLIEQRTGSNRVEHRVASVTNAGPVVLTNITVTIEGVEGESEAQLALAGIRNLSATLSTTTLQPGSAASLSLSFTAVNASSHQLALRVCAASHGVQTIVALTVAVRPSSPTLALQPGDMRREAVYGVLNLYTFNATNLGDAETGPMSISVTPNSELSVVAPIEQFILPPGGFVEVTFAFIANGTQRYGRYTDSIRMHSSTTSATLDIDLSIVVSRRCRLNISVTDEFTYLSSGHPMVQNASVRVENPNTGFAITLASDSSGMAIFDGVQEGAYYVTVQKPRHQSHRQVVVVDKPDVPVEVFLFVTTVSYQWTVTPTLVVDRYTFTLDIEVDNQVPAPVITVEPSRINLDDIERAAVTRIMNFALRNEGLIVADSIEMTFPEHPTVSFELLAPLPETIPPQITVVVPIRVTVNIGEDPGGGGGRRRVAREAAGGTGSTRDPDGNGLGSGCNAGIRYCYLCGGPRCRSTPIVIDTSTCGTDGALAWSGGFYGGGGGGGGGGGSASGGGSYSGVRLEVQQPLDCRTRPPPPCTELGVGAPGGAFEQLCGNSEKIFSCMEAMKMERPCAELATAACRDTWADGCAEGLFKTAVLGINCGAAHSSLKQFPAVACGAGIVEAGHAAIFERDTLTTPQGVIGFSLTLLETLVACATFIPIPPVAAAAALAHHLRQATKLKEKAEQFLAISKCVNSFAPGGGGGRRRRRRGQSGAQPRVRTRRFTAQTRLEDATDAVYATSQMVVNYINMVQTLTGSARATRIQQPSFAAALRAASSNGSPDGPWFSTSEAAGLVQTAVINVTESNVPTLSYVPGGANASGLAYLSDRDVARRLVHRINSTMTSWYDGQYEPSATDPVFGGPAGMQYGEWPVDSIVSFSMLSELAMQFGNDTVAVQQEGFASVLDAFGYAINAFEEAHRDSQREAGTCATIKVRLSQEIAMTRSAFEARLEISNDGDSPLTDIRVEFHFTKPGSPTVFNEVFSVSAPETDTAFEWTNGSGFLAAESSGMATWLIMPYEAAAPTHEEVYFLGGTLTYITRATNGTERLSSNRLYPTMMSVRPDAHIVVKYFLDTHIAGDDPFTVDMVEPSLPATLGMLMTNNGYGVARDVTMVSAQPEIIENDKGLLISFELVSVLFGNAIAPPTLAVPIGDLFARSSVEVRWLLTSSLQGRIAGFNASFEGNNPIGDADLNLIKSVSTHALVHTVWLTADADDGSPDFLALDESPVVLPVANELDRVVVYDSRNCTLPIPVALLRDASTVVTSPMTVQISAACVDPACADGEQWVYLKIPTPLPNAPYPARVLAGDSDITVGYNSWHTRRVTRRNRDDGGTDVSVANYLHVFWWSSSPASLELTVEFSPTPMYGNITSWIVPPRPTEDLTTDSTASTTQRSLMIIVFNGELDDLTSSDRGVFTDMVLDDLNDRIGSTVDRSTADVMLQPGSIVASVQFDYLSPWQTERLADDVAARPVVFTLRNVAYASSSASSVQTSPLSPQPTMSGSSGLNGQQSTARSSTTTSKNAIVPINSSSTSGSSGSSGGAVAGIVIGVLVVLTAITVGIMWVRRTPIPCWSSKRDSNPYPPFKSTVEMQINPVYTSSTNPDQLDATMA